MMIVGAPHLNTLLQTERRRQASALRMAAACSMVAASAAAVLLGLSGWFIVGASLAGAAGLVAAQTFNYLLPAAAIRLLAILRTGSRYLERVSGHEAALRALADIRPALFAALAASPPEESLSLSSGEASARLVQDVGALETVFIRQALPWTLAAALVTGLGLTALAGPAPAIGLALFASLAILAARWFGAKAAKTAGAGVQIGTGELKDWVASLAAAAPVDLVGGPVFQAVAAQFRRSGGEARHPIFQLASADLNTGAGCLCRLGAEPAGGEDC
jgi:ATP-binding cassette subfamily C protein CydC